MVCWLKYRVNPKDNLFMLERLIEMVKGRNEEILVAFVYNYGESIWSRKKLFELMRDYGVHGNLVGLIGRIYNFFGREDLLK